MNNFKVGDRVKILEICDGCIIRCNYIGRIGIIVQRENIEDCIGVILPGRNGWCCLKKNILELMDKKEIKVYGIVKFLESIK